jgi:hypothetical protein
MGRSRSSSKRAPCGGLLPVVAALVALCEGVIAAEGELAPPIAVVVGSSSPLRSVSVDELRDVYLRRQRVWTDGSSAVPVNLPADHPLRVAFSRRVLGRGPVDLESYWRRLYIEGLRPPLVLRTGQAVCAYVAVELSAIGYVRRDEVDPTSCRVVHTITDAPAP